MSCPKPPKDPSKMHGLNAASRRYRRWANARYEEPNDDVFDVFYEIQEAFKAGAAWQRDAEGKAAQQQVRFGGPLI